MSALSIAAYDAAITHEALLESHLYSKKQILRQGSVYSIRPDALLESPSNHRFEFRLDMLEPVSQGYAEAGRTTLFVTSLTDTSEDEDEDGETDTSTLGFSSDDESVEISHDFLANSVVYPTYNYNPISPSISNPSVDLHAEGELHFTVHALSNPVSILHDDYTVYLRTADLGRLGVLSGDWVRVIVMIVLGLIDAH